MGLGLAHQVRAHVGRFGVDAAADTVKHGDDGTAQGIARQRHGERDKAQPQEVHVTGVSDPQLAHPQAEHHIGHKQPQQREAAHTQAHDRAAPEGNLDGRADILGFPRPIGDADIGICGNFHAHQSGAAGHQRADQQRRGCLPHGYHSQDHSHQDNDQIEHPILIVQEGIGAHPDRRGNFLHPFIALRQLFYRKEIKCRVGQRQAGRKDENHDHELHT